MQDFIPFHFFLCLFVTTWTRPENETRGTHRQNQSPRVLIPSTLVTPPSFTYTQWILLLCTGYASLYLLSQTPIPQPVFVAQLSSFFPCKAPIRYLSPVYIIWEAAKNKKQNINKDLGPCPHSPIIFYLFLSLSHTLYSLFLTARTWDQHGSDL